MTRVRDETVRDEAIAWCGKLARDRAEAAWSIRFTHDDIRSSPAKQVAWRAHLTAKEKLGKDAPPRKIWAEAERLLRAERTERVESRPAKTPPPEKPPPRPPPPSPSSPPPKPLPKLKPSSIPKPKKEPQDKEARVAKKQTRRTISVSRAAYEDAKEFAAKKGVPLSQLAEAALAYAIENFREIKIKTEIKTVRDIKIKTKGRR